VLMTAAFLLLVAVFAGLVVTESMVNPIFLVNRNTALICACLFSFAWMLAIALLLPAVLAVTQTIGRSRLDRCCLVDPGLIFSGVIARTFDAPVR